MSQAKSAGGLKLSTNAGVPASLFFKKVKVGFFYSATYSGNAATSRAVNRRKWQLIGKSQWCCSANCGHPLHALTYNWTRGMQLANTPFTRWRRPCEETHIRLHLTTQLSTSKGWKAESTWLARYITYRNKVPPPESNPDTSPIPVLTGFDVE